MTPREARAALIRANGEVKSAADTAAKARAATTAARTFLAGVVAELEQLRATNTHVAGARSLDIVSALKDGRSPELKPLPGLQKNAGERANAENTLEAARLALERLGGEELLAAGDLTGAEVRAADAIKAVLIAEADEMAARVRVLEGEALQIRIRLGFAGGFISRLAPDRLGGVSAPDLETNSRPFLEAKASSAIWANFAKALAVDADAHLEF